MAENVGRFYITVASTLEDLADIASLFNAYTTSLGIDLAFQDFATELASLPGRYSPPSGTLLLARDTNSQAIGCVALRPQAQPEFCEMKRLYVSPHGRGLGLGRALAERVVRDAGRMGHRFMRLDTLPSMAAARALYGELGFEEVGAYYETPLEGTIFLELDLAAEVALPSAQ
ncbi:hypothetical protein LTR53_016812 [Teratosphaeriaceae sp. CCFEE 6253]|nr:hypothetical protein LTR53_016812 [Teratosphaeriaceae sp. CCFEE 6253]